MMLLGFALFFGALAGLILIGMGAPIAGALISVLCALALAAGAGAQAGRKAR